MNTYPSYKKILAAILLGLGLTASTCLAQSTQPDMSVNPVSAEAPSQAEINKSFGNFHLSRSTINSIKPGWALAEIKPGDSVTDSIIAVNENPSEITIRLSGRDSIKKEDGTFGIQALDKIPVELGSWITLEETDIVIPPNESKEVKYTLTVPETTALGIYQGGIAATQTRDRDAKGILIHATVVQPVQITVTNDPQPIPLITPPNLFTSILSSGTPYLWGSTALFVAGVIYFIYGTIREKKKKTIIAKTQKPENEQKN